MLYRASLGATTSRLCRDSSQQCLTRVNKSHFSTKTAPIRQHQNSSLHAATKNYEVWIGLETHAQITSQTKLFSAAGTNINAAPNSQTSLFDASIPGTLPRLNSKCVEQAIRTGLALGGTPQLVSHFDRKHYFYCDMPLGFQITQQHHPIILGGTMNLDSQLPKGETRDVRISRIQLEQDSGKSHHDIYPGKTLINLNRAGSALMEIVTEPDLRSSAETTAYLRKLQTLLRTIGSSSGNMEDGSFRCDVNVTVKRINPPGKMTGRVEIKNMMSFRSISRAIDYEVQRQIAIEEEGGAVERETRQWDVSKQKTYRLRKKEDLLDYRFMPEPDIPTLQLKQDKIDEIKNQLPELPDAIFNRLTTVMGLTKEEANIIMLEQGAVDYFTDLYYINTEETSHRAPKICYNWLTSELFGKIRRIRSETNDIDNTHENLDGELETQATPLLFDCPISANRLGELIDLVTQGSISGKQAKVVLDLMFKDTRAPGEIAEEKKLVMDSNPERLTTICEQIIQLYPEEVQKALSGRDHIFKFLCGQGLKLSQKQNGPDGQPIGEANPKRLAEIMRSLVDKQPQIDN